MGVKLLPDKEAIKMETIYHHPDGGGSTHHTTPTRLYGAISQEASILFT
jgi:hypothetical protein